MSDTRLSLSGLRTRVTECREDWGRSPYLTLDLAEVEALVAIAEAAVSVLSPADAPLSALDVACSKVRP